MRMSASVVLSSIILTGWLVAAKAQNLDLDQPPAVNQGAGGQADASEPGQIPQPSLESPGVVAGVTLGQLYTDNLRLAAGNQPKQKGWITQIQPFVRAAAASPRFTGMVDYELTGYLYEQPSGHNQLTQNFNAHGTLTILPQHFFLGGTALYGNEIINNQLPAGSGTYFLTNNRTNVGIATLSPYWLQDLGNAGIMTLRYTAGRVVYTDRGIPGESSGLLDGIPNVTMNAVQFDLASPKYQTWGWNLDYSEERMHPDYGRSWDFAVAKAGGSFQVNDNLQLLGEVGKENKFLPDGTVQKLGAPFWDAGFQWSNARDSLRLTAGHRFFGRSYDLSWTHQAALLTTNVSYVEQPTTYNQQLLGMNFGAGGLPPIEINPGLPSLAERNPYLMKRLSASADYTMPRGRLTLRAYDELRTYFADNSQQERVAGASLAWLFDLGPFTTLTPSFWWQRYQFRDGQINDTRFAELALVHQLNPKNFGSVRVRHDVGGVSLASQGAHGYTANVLFVQWTHLF